MARRRALRGPVDLLGLNSFGQNPGMSPIFGFAIGGGVAAATTIAIRHTSTTQAQNAEGIGFLAGLAVSGAMYAMKSTRHAAIASAIGATFASGIAWLEKKFLGAITVAVPGSAASTAPAAVAGMGLPIARNLNGLGIAQMRALNGMGIPMASNVPRAAGAIPGVAGSQLSGPGGGGPPVSLMGQPSAAAVHLLGVGGPPTHGIAASYGATLLGAGR